MLICMARTTITMDDLLLNRVKDAAGSNISGWIARACRSQLLKDGAEAEAEWAQAHPEEGAARTAEAEAEAEAWYAAEEDAERRRRGVA